MTLSRAGKIYNPVFDFAGFPKPEVDTLPSGLFLILLALSVFGLIVTFLLFRVIFSIIGFLTGGWYFTFKGPDMQMKEIEPWPRVFGVRFSPGILLALGLVSYHAYIRDLEGATSIVIALIIMFVLRPKSGETSPAMDIAERYGSSVDGKIVQLYYKKPLFLPIIRLVA